MYKIGTHRLDFPHDVRAKREHESCKRDIRGLSDTHVPQAPPFSRSSFVNVWYFVLHLVEPEANSKYDTEQRLSKNWTGAGPQASQLQVCSPVTFFLDRNTSNTKYIVYGHMSCGTGIHVTTNVRRRPAGVGVSSHVVCLRAMP